MLFQLHTLCSSEYLTVKDVVAYIKALMLYQELPRRIDENHEKF
jgi:hypothetical protein